MLPTNEAANAAFIFVLKEYKKWKAEIQLSLQSSVAQGQFMVVKEALREAAEADHLVAQEILSALGKGNRDNVPIPQLEKILQLQDQKQETKINAMSSPKTTEEETKQSIGPFWNQSALISDSSSTDARDKLLK